LFSISEYSKPEDLRLTLTKMKVTIERRRKTPVSTIRAIEILPFYWIVSSIKPKVLTNYMNFMI